MELCRARRSALSAEKNAQLSMTEMLHLIARQHVPAWQVLYSWFLAKYGARRTPSAPQQPSRAVQKLAGRDSARCRSTCRRFIALRRPRSALAWNEPLT